MSPVANVLRSNPPENSPSLPVIINAPESLGTFAKSSFTWESMSYEKAFALPSSSLIIEISPSLDRVAIGSAIFFSVPD